MNMFYEKARRKIVQMQSGQILNRKGDIYADSTIRSYSGVLVHLKEFEKDGSPAVNDYFKKFQLFLINSEKSKNTVATIMGNVYAVLGLDDNVDFPKARISNELTTAVYNSQKEINRLTTLNFDNLPGYDRARDIYVIHCNIGTRFSDLCRIVFNLYDYLIDSDGRKYFQVKTRKAGNEVVIPLNSQVLEIMEKRNFDFGKKFSLSYYNKMIKKIGGKAGFNDRVLKNITIGGRMTEQSYRKWELMSSHTARRSFATNALLAGIPETEIMKIGGWSTVDSFHRYLRADKLLSAKNLANNDFFK